jgi:hypothetical protein
MIGGQPYEMNTIHKELPKFLFLGRSSLGHIQWVKIILFILVTTDCANWGTWPLASSKTDLYGACCIGMPVLVRITNHGL